MTTTALPGYTVGTWDIDTLHSLVEFTVRHMGVGKSRGRFGSFQGEIVTAENPLESSVTATIDTASVSTGSVDRDNHLAAEDFLGSAEHPTMTFRSTGIRQDGEDFLIDGELTLRGTTKPVTLEVEPGGFNENGLAGASAKTVVNRRDFGVGPEGGAMIGEKVTITLEIEAQKRS